jgi:two-component system, chemotaxis family, chemotaxis protein CheY
MAKIMIVEDTTEQRDFLVSVLRTAGHEVQSAQNGQEAIQHLNSDTFDLIVTDIFMPDCDGLELIRRIRQSGKQMPVIAVSAGLCGNTDLFLRTAEFFGADAILTKSELPGEIAAAVTKLLAQKPQ